MMCAVSFRIRGNARICFKNNSAAELQKGGSGEEFDGITIVFLCGTNSPVTKRKVKGSSQMPRNSKDYKWRAIAEQRMMNE